MPKPCKLCTLTLLLRFEELACNYGVSNVVIVNEEVLGETANEP